VAIAARLARPAPRRLSERALAQTICGRGSYNSRRGQRRANRRRLAEGRELCLGPTKANVKEGEFKKGVELPSMGLTIRTCTTFCFGGSETVGGLYGRENFLDRPRAGRLQSATATSDRYRTVGLQILKMGAPFEVMCAGRVWHRRCRTGQKQIDIDDYVDYLKPRSEPGTARLIGSPSTDCHNFNYRPTISPTRRWPRPGPRQASGDGRRRKACVLPGRGQQSRRRIVGPVIEVVAVAVDGDPISLAVPGPTGGFR